MKMVTQFVIGVSFVAMSACGGGSGGGKTKNTTDTITINMSPLRVVGFSDDAPPNSLYTRNPDEPGLLTGLRPGLARAASPSIQGMLKDVSAYTRRD